MGSKKFKTKANRGAKDTSTFCEHFDSNRFHTLANHQKYESLVKLIRSIWCERKVVLDELDPFDRKNIGSRGWLSICTVLKSPPGTIIRDFYSNLSAHSAVSGGTT